MNLMSHNAGRVPHSGNSAALKIVAFLILSIPATRTLWGQPYSVTHPSTASGESNTRPVQGNQPPSADLTLEKTAPLAVAAVDDFFSYTLKVTNQGQVDSGALVIEDYLPDGVDFMPLGGGLPEGVTCRTLNQGRTIKCGMQSLAAMASIELSVRVQVNGDAYGLKSNLAVVSSPDEDPLLTDNNRDKADVTFVPRTDLNRDGLLDGRDAAQLVFELNDGDGDLVANVAGGSFPGNADFDVDGDGRIDQDDVVELARVLLFRVAPESPRTGAMLDLSPQGSSGLGSILDFPRLGFEAGKITGIAIVNPNDAAARVTLTAYSDLGQELVATEFNIEAGQQLSKLTFEVFGQLDSSTVGWFQATSPAPDLAGFFLDLDDTLAELDGADLPERANEIVFNNIKVDNGLSTELNIVNPNLDGLTVGLTLVGTGPGSTTSLEIAAMGSARVDVFEIFGIGAPAGTQVTADSYIVATASAEILGFQVIRSGSGDFQALNARNALEFLNKIYVPQMAVLGGIESELGLVNYSGQAVLATVTVYDPDGLLYVNDVQQNPVVVSLAAGQTTTHDLATLFGFQGDQLREGWLEVSSTSQGINGFFTYYIPATGARAATSAIPAPTNVGLFSHLATVPGFFTGVAALNTAAFPADFRILALSKEGEVFGTFTGILRPGQRISKLITELIPASDGQGGGFIFIRSSIPLFLISLFGTEDVSVLANIPPQIPPRTFAPDVGIEITRVDPPYNVLQPGSTQSFTLPGAVGDVRWTVNEVEGGSVANGLITPLGVYTAPEAQPSKIPVVVIGEAEGLTSSASVDVIAASSIRDDLGDVQSVAFLENLGLLYTAELNLLGPEASPAQGSATSTIFSITPESREELSTFDGEISQIVPFSGRDLREYLLLLDTTFGNLIRFDPETQATRTIVSGLENPSAVAQDPLSGDLLIADSNQVIMVTRFDVEQDLEPALATTGRAEGSISQKLGVAAPLGGISGIAIDKCTGLIYLSRPALGKVVSLDSSTGVIEDVVTGLTFPFRLFSASREGTGCPDATHLFIVERGRNQVDLYVPSEDTLIAPWLEANRASDIQLLPPRSRFKEESSLVLSRKRGDKQVLSLIDVGSIYGQNPVNPPPNISAEDRAPSPGPDLAVAVKSAKRDRLIRLPLLFRPGPDDGQPGGGDELLLLMFSLDFDEKRLIFDPTDADNDGVPDSISINVPDDYLFVWFYEPALKNRELAFLMIDTEFPFRPLPEAPNVTIQFRTTAQKLGTAVVGFKGTVPQIVDVEGNLIPFDQILTGGVRVKR